MLDEITPFLKSIVCKDFLFVCLFANLLISQVFGIIENFLHHLLVGFWKEKNIAEYSLHSRLSNMLAHLTIL